MANRGARRGRPHTAGRRGASSKPAARPPREPIGPLELGPIAHGGHVVARHEGRVIFVRHGLPGELVTVRLTDVSHAKFWRGDVEQVLRAAPERVHPPCPVAGRCGGCDFQHVDPEAQLDLLTSVVAELLQRQAGITWQGRVESVGAPLHWRTRMRYHVRDGRVGLRAHRSDELVDLPEQGCLIASTPPAARTLRELASTTPDGDLVVATSLVAGHEATGAEHQTSGEHQTVPEAEPSGDERTDSDGQTSIMQRGRVLLGTPIVRQRVAGREFEVATDGFWQPHRLAPQVLTEAVLEGLQPRPGEVALDLYCGVGLFAGALADAGAEVLGVELAGQAVRLARQNVPEARFVAGNMDDLLDRLPERCDLLVLDPPRQGAGRAVVRHLAGLGARAIGYVSCDPAALARDLALFAEQGWVLDRLRAFDLFPMTHHVECFASLVPATTA